MADDPQPRIFYREYPLQDGYIHNWLVAGPQQIPRSSAKAGEKGRERRASGITSQPVEQETFAVTGDVLTWQAYTCHDDHLVDLTGCAASSQATRVFAYAQLNCKYEGGVIFRLTGYGSADVWVNGCHHHTQEPGQRLPHTDSFKVELCQGRNDILARFASPNIKRIPCAIALQVAAQTPTLCVEVPTHSPHVDRYQKLERIFQGAYLERDVYTPGDPLIVHWPANLREWADATIRLQTPAGRIHAEFYATAKASTATDLSRARQVPDGPYQVVLMPRPEEYHVHGNRVEREIDLYILNSSYADGPYGTYPQRRLEALGHAARQQGSLFAEIAKMALGQWSAVDPNTIRETVDRIDRRADGSALSMVGLLGMLYRYRNDPSFPYQLKRPLRASVLNFEYWMDTPGSDAICYWSEGNQILFHACEILAGQLYPNQLFSNVGQPGRWHQEQGERRALDWLQKRGQGGFREWDSGSSFEEVILALIHLADLAESTQVAEMAAVVLDKIFFTMGLNSYKGVFGSTHGRTYAAHIKGAHLAPTAGISRLMWGTGVFNHHIAGVVGLACAEQYVLPSILSDIATDLPAEMWNRERHAGQLETGYDGVADSWEVNKVTFKTPDYMLSSAQDYRPGQSGNRQHIWQATLGPDAVVFVNHPACRGEQDAHRPGFWHGNVVLPRVAQWRDMLIAVHRLSEDDWMGFTHAYFPVYAFDEYVLNKGWAFARKGDGYLALTAAQGLTLTTQGEYAFRELRSPGHHNIWLCHMGRAAQDGSFGDFRRRVAALDVNFSELAVHGRTLRGHFLDFGWNMPLRIDGEEQPITGFQHYENPYCVADLPASQLEIQFRDLMVRLHYA